jgi:hypothetical protein
MRGAVLLNPGVAPTEPLPLQVSRHAPRLSLSIAGPAGSLYSDTQSGNRPRSLQSRASLCRHLALGPFWRASDTSPVTLCHISG